MLLLDNLLSESAKNRFEMTFGLNEPSAQRIYKGDKLRWKLTKDVWENLNHFPLGKGFVKNAHINFVMDLISAAGYVGLFLLTAIGWLYVKLLVDTHRRVSKTVPAGWAAAATTISWMLVGVMYNALYVGMGWMMIGILIGLRRQCALTGSPIGR